MMTITVAFGTSTPTSTTVVATRTSIAARRRNSPHHPVLLLRVQPAVQDAEAQPRPSGPASSVAATSRTASG